MYIYIYIHTYIHTYIYVCMYVCIHTQIWYIFIHSFADEHLGCVYILEIVNNASLSIMLHVSFQISIFAFFLDIYAGVELLGHIRLPRCFSNKESTCNAGDADSIPGSGRTPREGNGNPLQYSCLGNPLDKGAW